MKRIYSMLLLLLLVVTVTACSIINGQNKNEVYGKVTEVNGSEVTVELGEMNQKEQGNPPNENSNNSSQPPEKPEGEDSNEKPPESPDGEMPNDSSKPPELPDEEKSENLSNKSNSSDENKQDSSSVPPELPEGDKSDDSNESDENKTKNSSPEKSDNSEEGSKATSNGTPPESPNGMSDSNSNGETKTYNLGNITVKEQTGNEVKDSSINNIKVGSIVKLEIGSNQKVLEVTIINESSSALGQGEINQGSSANTISKSKTITDKTYESTGDDENALRVDGAEVKLDNIRVDKKSGSSSNVEDGDFYGMNAALLVTNGATATINNSEVHSSAQNGNGIFSYGSGTTTNISNTKITTEKDNSGGIQTTGGATTNATNLTVETSGNSSAAIRSDRGGGKVNVTGGSYVSSGLNSPAIYSTATIKAENAELKANNSESLVIEGKNSIDLTNCNVTGNMNKTDSASSDINVHNVMIYQSMSGDADVGTASMNLKGGSLTGNSGDMFYITNTSCKMNLENVAITNKDSNSLLMRVSGNNAKNGWGKAGSNGAQAEVNATSQTLNGNIEVDTISTLNLTLSNNSSLTGTINIVNNEENGEAVENNAIVTIDENSTWNLTGDCKISSLTNHGTINYNGFHITLADGTVLG